MTPDHLSKYDIKLLNLLKSKTSIDEIVARCKHTNEIGKLVGIDAGFLCLRLGISTEFFLRLKDEEGLTFVLKMHALMESALNFLCKKRIDNNPLRSQNPSPIIDDLVNRLNLEGRAGKIDLAKRHGLLTLQSRRFIQALSQLRNNYAHDLHYLELPLNALVREEVEKDANFPNKIFLYLDLAAKVGIESFEEVKQNSLGKPEGGIWMSSFLTLSSIYGVSEPNNSAVMRYLSEK